MVPRGLFHHLQAVVGLPKGRREARHYEPRLRPSRDSMA
jgi:hypothetical protein